MMARRRTAIQADDGRLYGWGFERVIASAEGVSAMVDTAGIRSRDTLATRKTCLKPTSAFSASRPELKSADVLALAEWLHARVTR